MFMCVYPPLHSQPSWHTCCFYISVFTFRFYRGLIHLSLISQMRSSISVSLQASKHRSLFHKIFSVKRKVTDVFIESTEVKIAVSFCQSCDQKTFVPLRYVTRRPRALALKFFELSRLECPVRVCTGSVAPLCVTVLSVWYPVSALCHTSWGWPCWAVPLKGIIKSHLLRLACHDQSYNEIEITSV